MFLGVYYFRRRVGVVLYELGGRSSAFYEVERDSHRDVVSLDKAHIPLDVQEFEGPLHAV